MNCPKCNNDNKNTNTAGNYYICSECLYVEEK